MLLSNVGLPAVGEWRQHMNACIRAGGGYFEHVMWCDLEMMWCDTCDFETLTAIHVAIQLIIQMYT